MKLIRRLGLYFQSWLAVLSAIRYVADTHNRVRLLEQRLLAQQQSLEKTDSSIGEIETRIQQLLKASLDQERVNQQQDQINRRQEQTDAELGDTLSSLGAEIRHAVTEVRESAARESETAASDRYYFNLALQRQVDHLLTRVLRGPLDEIDPLTPGLRGPSPPDPHVPSIPAHPDNHRLADQPYLLLNADRLAPSSGQHRLIDTLYALRESGEENLALVLAGPADLEHRSAYGETLRRHAARLGLADQVHILSDCSPSTLAECYLKADLYLALHDWHEPDADKGATNPAHERIAAIHRALSHDLLTIVHWPFGEAPPHFGLPRELCTDTLAADAIAAHVRRLMDNPRQRRRQLCAQREAWMAISAGKAAGGAEASGRQPLNIRVEGPFDSTYSLALVNRAVALALRGQGERVTLHSTDGCGDSRADRAFLRANPEVDAIRRAQLPHVDVTLRNLYPPRTNAMGGIDKVIGPYGWEESRFPATWMQGFNRRLTAVLCMSDYVRDVLLANGLRVPAITTGIVADTILKHRSKTLGVKLPEGYRLLHISSGFPRKGIDLLLDVLPRLPDDSVLILKTFPNPHNDVRRQLLARSYDGVRLEATGIPSGSPRSGASLAQAPCTLWARGNRKIVLIDADIDPGQIAWLYRHADQLVAPSRGEGFGLPMAEAMLLDVPVVTTDRGGQRDFCTEETAWLIDSRLSPAKTHFELPGSEWAEPDPISLENAIIEIRQSSAEARRAKTQRARELIRSRYDSQAVAGRIREAFSLLDQA